MRRNLWIAALVLVCAASSQAQAEPCGEITAAGECRDAKRLVWCQDGELKSMQCGAGEVCVPHDNFDGGVGCIGTEYTDCGAITEVGECTSENSVVWCDVSRVKVRACDEGTTCTFVEEEGWYDCVSGDGTRPHSGDPDPDPSDGDVIEPGQDVELVAADVPATGQILESPVPEVQKGGADSAGSLVGGGGGGCGVGGGGRDVVLASLLVLLIFARRRRLPVHG